MTLGQTLSRLLVIAMVSVSLALGLSAVLLTIVIGEGPSAIVILFVFAALIVQIVHFQMLTRQLSRLDDKVKALTPAASDHREVNPPSPATVPPPPVQSSKPLQLPPVGPIHGSSKNPPPSRQGHSVPGSAGKPTAHQQTGFPPAARPAETFDENPAASLRVTQEILAEMDRQEALGSPIAAGREPAPAPLRSPASAATEPKPGIPQLHPTEIAQVWNRYLEVGNGQFNTKGLQEFLGSAGIRADVLPPDDLVGMGNPVLGISEPGSRERVFLLPDFTRPPKAVSSWFDLDSEIRNSTRMNRLVRVAELRRRGERYELQRGTLE